MPPRLGPWIIFLPPRWIAGERKHEYQKLERVRNEKIKKENEQFEKWTAEGRRKRELDGTIQRFGTMVKNPTNTI